MVKATFFAYLRSMFRGDSLADFTSPEREEERALRVATRFSRGNTNLQDGRVITDRIFEKQMNRYAEKVNRKKFIFAR